MKKTIRIISALMIVFICFSFISCGSNSKENETETETEVQKEAETEEQIKIPDVKGLDEETAKTLLAKKGLIPKVEYEYDDDVPEGEVVKTKPSIGSSAKEDDIITIIISKGASYYMVSDAVGWIDNVQGINPFSWGDNGEEVTKGFTNPHAEEGNLYIPIFIKCTSNSQLAFYKDFGTASINDTFDKTVPIRVEYDSIDIDNNGGQTNFTLVIPLTDLGVQKPTNIYANIDLTVDGQRQTLNMRFNLSW